MFWLFGGVVVVVVVAPKDEHRVHRPKKIQDYTKTSQLEKIFLDYFIFNHVICAVFHSLGPNYSLFLTSGDLQKKQQSNFFLYLLSLHTLEALS